MADERLQAWLWPYAGIAAALAVALGGALLVAIGAPPPLRVPAAVGLILWAPGFAFTLAVFPAGAIGRVERTVLAVAASVALTAIAAVVLDAVGVRLETPSFVISACLVTSIAAAAALRRMPGLAEIPDPAPIQRPTRTAIAIGVGVCVVLGGAVVAARITPQPAGIPGSSALGVTTSSGSLRAEVISAEVVATKYRLTMRTGDRTIEVARFTLLPGASWHRELRRPKGSVRLFLHRDGRQGVYRRLVVPGAPA
jgi:hypothetical protein